MLTDHIEHEADEAVMGCEYHQDFVNQHDMLEIVYHTLSVEEIHGHPQEIPVERSREPKILRPARDVGNGDDFFEGHNLNCRHDPNHIDVPREHGGEKDRDHDQGPYRSGDECLLLLLVVRYRNICALSKQIQGALAMS